MVLRTVEAGCTHHNTVAIHIHSKDVVTVYSVPAAGAIRRAAQSVRNEIVAMASRLCAGCGVRREHYVYGTQQ